jgi:hypothetical protein
MLPFHTSTSARSWYLACCPRRVRQAVADGPDVGRGRTGDRAEAVIVRAEELGRRMPGFKRAELNTT